MVGLAEAGAVTEAVLRDDIPWKWPTVVLGVVLIPVLYWRRSHPLAVVSACFGAIAVLSVADLATGEPRSTGLHSMSVLLLSLYAVARWGSGRDRVIGIGVAGATAALAIVADYTVASEAIGGALVIGITVAAGLAVRYRGRARQRELEQVRLLEREQLARDLHDTVAHHVTAIAVRAQAGIAVASTRPEAALEALRVIDAEAGRTLSEMRAMVGVLRDRGVAALTPTATLADLGRLAGDGSSGGRVVVHVGDGLDDLPPATATAICRIAQEAVTNAGRHARGATSVDITVERNDRWVRLRVVDDGAPVTRRVVGDGFGLRGMSERAELLGGSCTAGPAPQRGWLVEAELPLAELAR